MSSDAVVKTSLQGSRVCIFVGLAGSGKTSLLERSFSYARSVGEVPYIMNLDPAVAQLPYEANIDIRDTVNYKSVMKEYKLGPNGAILTSANLFATRFDKALSIFESRSKEHKLFFVDTPGQIEIFTWSASGLMFTDMFTSRFKTIVLYVIDTPRCENPQVLMGNMLQAVSILYRMRANLVLVFNKVDVTPHEPFLELLLDLNLFQCELERKDSGSFSNTLMQSLSIVLSEFYEHLDVVGVSATAGNGIGTLWHTLNKL